MILSVSCIHVQITLFFSCKKKMGARNDKLYAVFGVSNQTLSCVRLFGSTKLPSLGRQRTWLFTTCTAKIARTNSFPAISSCSLFRTNTLCHLWLQLLQDSSTTLLMTTIFTFHTWLTTDSLSQLVFLHVPVHTEIKNSRFLSWWSFNCPTPIACIFTIFSFLPVPEASEKKTHSYMRRLPLANRLTLPKLAFSHILYWKYCGAWEI